MTTVTDEINDGSTSGGAANADRISCWKLTPSTTYYITGIRTQLSTGGYSATQKIRTAVYSNQVIDGTDYPYEMLTQSEETVFADTTAWQQIGTFTEDYPYVTSTDKVWLAFWSNENMFLDADNITGMKVENSITYSSSADFPTAANDCNGNTTPCEELGKYNIGSIGNTENPSPSPGSGGTRLPPPPAMVRL